MRRAASLAALLLLPGAAVGFLPPMPSRGLLARPTSAAPAAAASSLKSQLFGGDYDLLKGSSGKAGGSKDPAPGEFDLLGSKADAEAAVVKEVGLGCWLVGWLDAAGAGYDWMPCLPPS